MSGLIKYEAACRALAECKAVDEVKSWADKAAAMQAYGRMAKDKTLEIDAAEIRIRAERRLGEMLAQQKAEGGLNQGSRSQLSGKTETGDVLAVVGDDRQKTVPKLADVGVSKDLSSRAQKLAAVPDSEFEAEIGEWRERVSAEGARVSARLEKAGERELKKAAQFPEDEPVNEPTEEEIAFIEQQQAADQKAMDIILESNGDLAALKAEYERQSHELAAVKAQRNEYMNKCAELIRRVKTLRGKLEKLEARQAA